MPGFLDLLRQNRNYRYAWTGQVVSEIGDHFNNIAVFSLALADDAFGPGRQRRDARARRPRRARGPARRRHARPARSADGDDRVATWSARVVALGFILTVHQPKPWLLYVLSGLLMFASPFFTSGRAAILPRIASKDELHTANSLTQTTQWTTHDHRHAARRVQRGAVRLHGGLRRQQPVVPVLGLGHLPLRAARRRASARRSQPMTEAD